MALKKLEASLDIISALGTNPGSDNDLNEEQLKAKFDEAANIIKDYLNNHLIPELDKTVDVDALLKDILDSTLSKHDKAANAESTGSAIRNLRSFFEKVVHSGDYVLMSGGSFAADNPSNMTVHIQDGTGVMQGNLFTLAAQNLELDEGTYGLNRNDLIVVRGSRASDNSLTYSFEVLKGTNTSGDPVDPAYQMDDINLTESVREFPIYRVKFEGLNIAQIEPLFAPEKTFADQIADQKTKKVPVTLLASGWSASAPYTQAVAVPGLTDEKQALAYPDVPEDATQEAAFMEEAGKITSCRRSGSTMTFRCREEKPEIDIPVIVEVYV